MSIQLPFKMDEFLKLADGKMALARNLLPDTKMEHVGFINFKADGTYSGDLEGTFRTTEDGVVVLNDKWNKPVYCFRGAETRNGSTFMVGEPYQEAHFSGFVRCVLYKYLPLTDFQVCISTHKDYMAETMSRVIRSLVRAGFPKDRVVVVVGGNDKNDVTVADGCKTILTTENYDWLTALSALPKSDFNGYWLLLHDTCEVMDDFKERMANVNVGLNFDHIDVFGDIGLYWSPFLQKITEMGIFKGQVSLNNLRQHYGLWMQIGSSRHVATKDIYGTGTQREVIYLDDIGVKKYRRVKGAAAKP